MPVAATRPAGPSGPRRSQTSPKVRSPARFSAGAAENRPSTRSARSGTFRYGALWGRLRETSGTTGHSAAYSHALEPATGLSSPRQARAFLAGPSPLADRLRRVRPKRREQEHGRGHERSRGLARRDRRDVEFGHHGSRTRGPPRGLHAISASSTGSSPIAARGTTSYTAAGGGRREVRCHWRQSPTCSSRGARAGEAPQPTPPVPATPPWPRASGPYEGPAWLYAAESAVIARSAPPNGPAPPPAAWDMPTTPLAAASPARRLPQAIRRQPALR